MMPSVPLIYLYTLALLSKQLVTVAIPTGEANSLSDAAPVIESRAPAQCPTCNPTSGQNLCHPTTSCVFNWAHPGSGHQNPALIPNYCACRAGYRAIGDPHDSSVQFRLPWYTQEGRVFVKPGVACDTLCDHWYLGPQGCEEVLLQPQCM
jgi:hypothetical protein